MPELAHTMILDTDIFREMEIIPNLRTGWWKFSTPSDEEIYINAFCPSQHLTGEQQTALLEVIGSCFKDTGKRIGCASVVKNRIRVSSEPIKQRYYPLSPKLQELVHKELRCWKMAVWNRQLPFGAPPGVMEEKG